MERFISGSLTTTSWPAMSFSATAKTPAIVDGADYPSEHKKPHRLKRQKSVGSRIAFLLSQSTCIL